MSVIEQTPEFLALIDADDAAETDDFDIVDQRFAQTLTGVLSHFGDGAGRRVLVVDHLDRSQLQVLSRWVGPAGRVDLVVGPADELDEVEAALADAAIPNGVLCDEAVTGAYDLVLASRTLYWHAPDSVERDRHLQWLASLIHEDGRFVFLEFDFTGWQFLPAAPALEELNAMVCEAFGYQFTAAREIPTVLERLGATCTLEASTTVLPADSGLGRRILSRARAFVDTGGFPASVRSTITAAEAELSDPDRWVLHPTVVLGWGSPNV